MKSLTDHNREALERFNRPPELRNGIACPKCGAELRDDWTRVLTSEPPQTPVFCSAPGCGFKGSRF